MMRAAGWILRAVPARVRFAMVDVAIGLRVAYLRWRLRWAQADLQHMHAELARLPAQIRTHRQQLRRWAREIDAMLADQTRRDAVDPTTLSGEQDAPGRRLHLVRGPAPTSLPPSRVMEWRP